jgi:1,2-diacylglycerol 3-beta-galactosyltransferase
MSIENVDTVKEEPLRVLILTADAGLGHRRAAEAIDVALRETWGEACETTVVNPLEDERVPSLLRESQTDYDYLVREMPRLYEFAYEVSDANLMISMVDGALAMMLFEVMQGIVACHRPDVIVTTYPLYQAPLSAVYQANNHYIPLLTVVTDLAAVHRLWFHAAADLCLVPTEAVRDEAVQSGIASDRIHVVGIPVHLDLTREDWNRETLRAELGWQRDLATALVVGSKRVEHLVDTLRVLNHSGLALQLAIVSGDDEDLYRALQAIEWHVTAHIYGFVTNVPAMMRAADCVISKAGGLIIAESLACGLPLLLIDALPGQEVGNAEHVVANGAGESAKNPLAVLETMRHWLADDGRLLAEKARSARRIGRPRAAYDVANLALAAARSGPRVPGDHVLGSVRLLELLKRPDVACEGPTD